MPNSFERVTEALKAEAKKPTRYMQKMFLKDWGEGDELWTGEDGMLTGFAIVRRPDWADVIPRNFSYRFENEKFDAARGEEKFLRREYADPDDFPGHRKIWMLCDDETPFPVIHYPLEHPL